MDMRKIGIMGGTFNPIHIGHIDIAKAAYEQYQLNEVWFMPNHIPAYKSDNNVVSGKHRMDMVDLAIMDYPYFILSDFEVNRQGKTYSYETFTLLNELYKDCQFYFIMGADSLFYFEKWVHPEIIIKFTKILVASRDENGIEEINNRIKILEKEFGDNHFFVIKSKKIECSSSKLRDCLSCMEVDDNITYIKKYLPSKVLEYIENNNLYM